MSGSASVSNTFQNAVTATGLQLDQNFTTVVAYINDPTNRNNYAPDTGNTGTILLSFAPPIVGGYSAGLEITFKAAALNAGAVVVNAQGLGNSSLVNQDGTELTVSQIVAGGVYKAVYNGSKFNLQNPAVPIQFQLTAATQADMETATVTANFATPQNMNWHPGMPKAWARWNATATGVITPIASYNIANITKGGTGTWTVVMSTIFSSTAWVCICGTADLSSRDVVGTLTQTASSAVVISYSAAGGADNPTTSIHLAAWGDQ